MNESEARALNRAAQFLPPATDEEKPAVRIGGALVYVGVDVDYDGAPILMVGVDTEDTVSNSGAAADGELRARFYLNTKWVSSVFTTNVGA